MSEAIHVDRQLDAKGMLCPMPVISVKRAIKDLQRGQVLVVSATDKGVAASLLERLGLSVMNVAGGTTAWMEAGLPLAQPDA